MIQDVNLTNGVLGRRRVMDPWLKKFVVPGGSREGGRLCYIRRYMSKVRC